jgi:PleD family two-component response regulator
VTISIGVTMLTDAHKSATDIIGDADAKLYEAKRGGRNKVVS